MAPDSPPPDATPHARPPPGLLGLRDSRGAVFPPLDTVVALAAAPGQAEPAIALYPPLPPEAAAPGEQSTTDAEMLHALLEATPDRVAFKDARGRYLRVSRSKAAMHHLADPADAIGKTDFDFFSADHAASALAAEQEVLRTGQPVIDAEEKLVYDDGRISWVSTSRIPFLDRAGQRAGTFTVSHDITASKEAEEALRESEVLFRSIFEGSNDAILLLTNNGIIDCNPRTEAMFACRKEQLVGLTPDRISPPHQPDGANSPAAAREHIATAFRVGYCRYDWVFRRFDGTDFPSEVLLAAFDFGGRKLLQGTVRDITERRRADAEYRDMQTQLQLAQKLESVGRLASGVAHEINTPTQFVSDNMRFLAGAFSQLELVLAAHARAFTLASAHPDCTAALEAVRTSEEENELGYLLGEIPRTLEQSLEGLTRITKIVGSLKEFSHPASKDMCGANLNRAIETAVAVSRHEWKYVAEVATELDPQLPAVPCVLDEFNQAILNLVINAAHAIGEANPKLGRVLGRITIRTRQEPGWAVVEVSDDGTGIPPEVQVHLFEPFFTTKGIGKGTGQGLAFVRNIVIKTHHGRLDFTTEVGKGTTFRLQLPLDPGGTGIPTRDSPPGGAGFPHSIPALPTHGSGDPCHAPPGGAGFTPAIFPTIPPPLSAP